MVEPDLTFAQLRRTAEQKMRETGIESAGLDARLLLSRASGYDQTDLIVHANKTVSKNIQSEFEELLGRRLAHEPLAYILESKEFWSLDFIVSPHILIPRPETEILVERALLFIRDIRNPRILDIGTGSGAILIALMHERADATGLGVDVSPEALDIARRNADQNGVGDRAEFSRSNYLDNVRGQFDIIVSNPPYITDPAMENLPETVALYEPQTALRGGPDGLAAYRSIIAGAPAHTIAGGALVFEIGYDQAAPVSDLLARNLYAQIGTDKDLSGHDRVVFGKLAA